MKNSDNWLNDKYVSTWLNGLANRTKENYLRELPEWIEFVKMSPTEQINKRLRDTASQNMADRTFFEQKFRAYKEHLEQNTELKAISVKTHLRTVSSFFSRNGLPLALKRGDWKSTLPTKVIKRFKLRKEDVKAMYTHASLRDRALLLVLAQSGFSEVDVCALCIEDIKDLWEIPQSEHYFIEKPREKTNIIQATCLSYEALHDIRAMLQERGKPTEGFLFTSQTKGKGEQMTTRTINDAMKVLAEKTFGKEKAKRFKTKALRSFYNSALLRAGIQSEIKDVMFGHERKGARGHYDYDEYTIKENYALAFEHISINGFQTREDIAKIREDLTAIIGKQQVQIEQTEKKLEELEDRFEAKLAEKIKELIDFINENKNETT
jgi:integrase